MTKMIAGMLVVGVLVPAIPFMAQVAASGVVAQTKSASAAPTGPQTGVLPSGADQQRQGARPAKRRGNRPRR